MKTSSRFVAAACLLMVGTAHAQTDAPEWNALDYSKRTEEGSIVFVPLKGFDASYLPGMAWYRSYYNVVEAPSTLSPSVRSVNVTVFPTAFANDGREWNEFSARHPAFHDEMRHWLTPTAKVCGFSDELLSFTDKLGADGQPTLVASGGYPDICHVTVRYRSADENAVLALLRAGKGIVLEDSVPLCARDSRKFPAKPVLDRLLAAGHLRPTSDMFEGDFYEIAYDIITLAQASPNLFAGEKRTGPLEFIRQVLPAPTAENPVVQFPSATQRHDVFLCTPEPLKLQYGR